MAEGVPRGGQAVDLNVLLTALRRHRRFVIVCAIVGAVVGLAIARLNPVPYSSKSVVLVGSPTSGGSQVVLDDATYVELAGSKAVLLPAIEAQGSNLTVGELRRATRIATLTPALIEIRVTDPDPAQAAALSVGVADSFVAYVKRLGSPLSEQARADLTAQIQALEDQADQIDKQLAAARKRQASADAEAPEGVREAQLVAALTAERSDLAIRITSLREQLPAAEDAGSVQLGANAQLLDRGDTPVRPGGATRGATAASLGALLGLAVGALWALRRTRRDRSIRSSRVLARATGSPVLVGLKSRPQRSPEDWRALLGSFTPPPEEVWAVKLMLRWLAHRGGTSEPGRTLRGRTSPLSVMMIALPADRAGQSIGPVFAAAAATLDVPTSLTGAGDPGAASTLWAGLALARRRGLERRMLEVTRSPLDASSCVLRVVLTVMDPQHPGFAELPPADAYLLCLSAGTATVEDVSRMALAADAAGTAITGVVLADPGDWDEAVSSSTARGPGGDSHGDEVIFLDGLGAARGAS